MKRKINKVGVNTLTVSLPSKWIKKVDIKAGDEIELVEDNKNLIIVTDKYSRKSKKAVLDLKDFNKMMLNRFFHEFYRQGVDQIHLNFENSEIPDYKKNKNISIEKYVKKLIDRFIGMEIVSQKKNKIVVESLITHDEWLKMDVISRRIYYLIKEFLNELINAINKNYEEFHAMSYDYHDNIAKFTYYYMRLLNQADYSEEKKSRLFGLFSIIDQTIDKIRHLSEKINSADSVSDRTISYLREIFDVYLSMFDYILKENLKHDRFNEILKRRYELVQKISKEKFTLDEYKIISETDLLLNVNNNFTESHVGINIDKFISEY